MCRVIVTTLGGILTLEVFSHTPLDVASHHWLVNQAHYQMSNRAVPLVLSTLTMATTCH